MFYGDYYANELDKPRTVRAIRAYEHGQLVKDLRTARRGTRSSLLARSSALILTLFR